MLCQFWLLLQIDNWIVIQMRMLLWDSNQPHSVYAQSKMKTEQVVFAIPRNQNVIAERIRELFLV